MRKPRNTGRVTAGLTVLAALLLLPPSAPAAPQESQSPAKAVQPTPTPRPRTLADIAKTLKLRAASKEQGQASGRIVITNSNLQEYAEKGGITTSSGQKPQPGTRPSALNAGQSRAEAEQQTKRREWRAKYQKQAALVSSMKTRIKELDKQIPGLWRQFYAWDDPAYRDGVIKPKLDKFLKERNTLAKRIPQEEAKLPDIVEQARRDGAQPGWFRDLIKP